MNVKLHIWHLWHLHPSQSQPLVHKWPINVPLFWRPSCFWTISRPRFNEAHLLTVKTKSGHRLQLSKVCPRNVWEPTSAIHFRVQTSCGSVLIYKWLRMQVNCVVSSNQCLRHTRTRKCHISRSSYEYLILTFYCNCFGSKPDSTGSQMIDQMCKTSSNSHEKARINLNQTCMMI